MCKDEDRPVKDFVTEIAGEHGLDSKISDIVSSHVYNWIEQQDETDFHFLERFAKRHGPLFSVKNGALLWLEVGAGKNAAGVAMPPAIIAASAIVVGTLKVTETDVDRFGTVKTFYQDHVEAGGSCGAGLSVAG